MILTTIQRTLSSAIAAIAVCGDAQTMREPIIVNPPPGVKCEFNRNGDAKTVDVTEEQIKEFLETLKAEQLMPPIDILLQVLAQQCPPPQAWFEEDFGDL